MPKFGNNIDMSSQKIVNLADGSSASDAATWGQVQSAQFGNSWKAPVRVASTTNLTLATPGATIDGVTMTNGDRVLLKDQTTASQNGIYVWNGASTTLTRATDANTSAKMVPNTSVFVQEGTVNADRNYTLTTNAPITLDTTSLTFVQFGTGATAYTAGNGLTLSSNQFAVNAGNGVIADGSSTRVDPSVVVRKYAITVGDGTTTTFTLTHNLGTTDIQVVVRSVATGEQVITDNAATSASQCTVTFATPPASGAYRVIVQG